MQINQQKLHDIIQVYTLYGQQKFLDTSPFHLYMVLAQNIGSRITVSLPCSSMTMHKVEELTMHTQSSDLNLNATEDILLLQTILKYKSLSTQKSIITKML